MRDEHIHKEARRIVRLCHTRDPFRIAKELGIHVLYRDDFDELLGMYTVIKRKRFIMLNSNLEKHIQKIVLAHEIGHDRFHGDYAKSPKILQNFGIHDMTLRPEREANIFAAEILIDDEWVFESAKYHESIDILAGELEVDINLVMIKLDELNRRGYDVRAPYRPQSDFLRRI